MTGTDVDCWAEEGGLGAGQSPSQPLPQVGPTMTGEMLARLVRTIEGEIVPRLMLIQRTSARMVLPAAAEQAVAKPDVSAFVTTLLRSEAAELSAYVESLVTRGVSVEELLLELFAPAARRLGRMWEEDACSFTDVTLALSHLHRLVHELRHDEQPQARGVTDEPRLLLTVTDREQHLFGLLVVADCFRNAGWHVDEDHVGSPRGLAATVRSTHFDLVGVSVSSEERVEPAAALVRTVRRASCNARVAVMAGGPVFLRVPGVADRLGVDAIATDGREAVTRARQLLATIAAAKTRRV
jgi:MerR family transcriptional regulator, light-induced transcriptional regulator